jgi:tRNA uridine 5-carboxymethylaminomethyl modification enzyme
MKQQSIKDEIKRLRKKVLSPSDEVNQFLDKYKSTRISTGIKLYDLLKRPEIKYRALKEVDDQMPELPDFIADEVSILIKYEGYISKQMQQIEQFKKMENRIIPDNTDYEEIPGLRIEAKQKLMKQKPRSLGQASRISGVSPADISVLVIYLNAKTRREKKK